MNVRLVPVDATVDVWPKIVMAAVDSPVVDRVVGAWMREHGCQNGDRIQARYIEIDSMDDAVLVWVVVTHSGLVLAVAQPPVGVSLPGGPVGVYLVSQAP